jgi:YVTN family beta-propeller protein
MSRRLALWLALVLAVGLLACAENPVLPIVAADPDEPLLLVVNLASHTLGVVRLDSLVPDAGDVTANALLLGEVPNDVAVVPPGDFAVVVDSGDDDLFVVDLTDTLAESARIDLGRDTNPWAVALDGDGGAFVSLWLAGEVARVDLAGRRVTARIPVGQTPQALLVAGRQLLVSLVNFRHGVGFGPGEVVVVDVDSGVVARRLAVGMNPQAIARAPDNRIHVVCTGNYGAYDPPVEGSIYVLDPEATAVVDSFAIGGSPAAVAFARGGKAYVTGDAGGVAAYDAATLARLSPLGAPIVPGDHFADIAWDDARDRLYVANYGEDLVYVVDTRTDSLVTALPLGDGPGPLALRP